MTTSHLVERTCIACRKKTSQASLIRLASPISGTLALWNGSGRSAYFCPNLACLDAALKPGRLAKSLRTSLSAEQIGNLKQELVCKLELNQ